MSRALDIIEAILKAEEVVPVADGWSLLSVVVEEIVLNIVDYSHSDYIDVEIIRDEESITLRFHDSGVAYNPLEREFPDFSITYGGQEDRRTWHFHGYPVKAMTSRCLLFVTCPNKAKTELRVSKYAN